MTILLVLVGLIVTFLASVGLGVVLVRLGIVDVYSEGAGE